MKITNSGHIKVGLLNEKMIKEKLMKKALNYMFGYENNIKFMNQIRNLK